MRRILGALLVAGTIASTGCASTVGTMLTEGRAPYAGVQIDAALVHENHVNDPALYALVVADFPFTVAADTLILPITATRAIAGK